MFEGHVVKGGRCEWQDDCVSSAAEMEDSQRWIEDTLRKMDEELAQLQQWKREREARTKAAARAHEQKRCAFLSSTLSPELHTQLEVDYVTRADLPPARTARLEALLEQLRYALDTCTHTYTSLGSCGRSEDTGVRFVDLTALSDQRARIDEQNWTAMQHDVLASNLLRLKLGSFGSDTEEA
jgi:hypothetical protein